MNAASSNLTPINNSLASKNLRGNNMILIILFGICIAVLVYLLVLFNRPSLLYYTIAGVPVKVNEQALKPIKNTEKLPSLQNGREYAFSFWTYIEAIENSDNYRLVFLRGNELGDANPIVYFDKNSNKMKIKIKTNAAGGTVTSLIPEEKLTLDSEITNISGGENLTLNSDTCKFATFEIDYVPLQRWVNIIINVDNYVVTVFMDGAIHSTRVLNQNNIDCTTELSKIVSETSGEVKVGNSSGLPAFNGYISKLQFFNYALKTQRHITRIYQNGPVQSLGILQKLGLPLYSFRNPVYRVDSIKAS